ncbi:hypothetical protein HWV62_4577 [Athelia sp. TMB]|nr:hypothetical protein HWV62_4577 [Athelia sp. TMB]
MDGPASQISTSQTLATQNSSGDGQSSTPAAPAQPVAKEPAVATNDADKAPATPAKRPPGRPKGSVKKPVIIGASGEIVDPANKVKRPVGRPRKDGLPAGSVPTGRSATRPARPRKSAPASMGGDQSDPGQSNEGGVITAKPTTFHPYQPPNQAPPNNQYQTIFSAKITSPSVPSAPLSRSKNASSSSQLVFPEPKPDLWADLAKSNPTSFLETLLGALAAPNPISTAGPSVEEAFKSHLVSLSPNSTQKEAQTIPSLYSILKTFWLPSSPAYFSLTASASTARTPSEHRFLYWDPQPLVFNGIACPVCATPLANRGRIRSGPMKIYDLERPFFIVGCEYACRSAVCTTPSAPEGRKFASTDSSILRSLPTRLRDEFPARLIQGEGDLGSGTNVWNWQATGVSRSLWNMVKGCLRSHMPSSAILNIIKAIQNGVPDDAGKKEEEEEEPEEEIQKPVVPVLPVVVQPPPPAPSEDAKQSVASDAYNNAWKAHSASTGSEAQANGQASPNMAVITPNLVVPQPFGFSQYVAHPYTQLTHQPPPPPPPIQAPQPQMQQRPVPPQKSPQTRPQQVPMQSPQHHHQQQHMSQLVMQAHPMQQQHSSSSNDTAEQPTLKRPYPYGDGAHEDGSLEPVQKRTRHCCKCGSQECKGKGGRSFCMNVCQDCGKLDCKGRNSRRPDKPCGEAW